jgi:protein-L-isoaspartate(D-aspartate) O-methyltransferase
MPDYIQQRSAMVSRYCSLGYLESDSVTEALLTVPREKFMDPSSREFAYFDVPLPIPGDGRQTISAPYMYPLVYEALNLKKGDIFLEVGAGSGYGAALAQEIVGLEGHVVAIEINPTTYAFAKANLKRTGYQDITLIRGDGCFGYLAKAPYNSISITAASPDFPFPLINQLKSPGRMVAPIGKTSIFGQDLVILEKNLESRLSQQVLMRVSYVQLVGEYGLTSR